MNKQDDKQKPNPDSETLAKVRFPKFPLFWTILVGLGIGFLHWQSEYLNETYNLNPGIPWVLTILLGLLTILIWAFWCFFFAKRRLLGMFICAVPAAFFTLFIPIFGGDANITGWKPRFWKTDVEFVTATGDTAGAVDLMTTTPLDFPQFLGANRNATVDGVRLSGDWSNNPPKQLWKIPVGEGWSGFAAVNGYAITQEQREAEECVTCYDIETGEAKWLYSMTRRHEDTMAMGKVGPRATPTIDEGLVYVTSATGVLDCLDGSNGELVWTKDIPSLVSIVQVPHNNSLGLAYTMEDSSMMWGRSCSPLIYEDKVIIPAGGPTGGNMTTLIALNKKTGREIWRGGNRMVAYGSPTVATILGRPQILLVAESVAVGHDPVTGKELWSHERPGSSNADANCSQVTVVSDSQVILSKGYNMGGELLELSQNDDWISVEVKHKDPRVLKTKFTNPVIIDGHAYSLSDGYLECTEVETFRRKWKQRGRFGNGQLLLVGDKLLVHSEWGELLLLTATPDGYEELGSVKTIEGICWNTLCLYGDKVIVRSDLEAACFQLPTE